MKGNTLMICLGMLWGVLGCPKNCYLGAGLYSRPVSSEDCCVPATDPHCFSYVEVGAGEFRCRQCQTGYHFQDGLCLKYPKREDCINPEYGADPAVPKCKVCRVRKNRPRFPLVRDGEMVCVAPDQLEETELPNLRRCLAVAWHEGVYFCHECRKGFYYDESKRKCISYKTKARMTGCLISFFWNRCDLCRPGFKYDPVGYRCWDENEEVDFSKLRELKKRKAQELKAKIAADPDAAKLATGLGGSQLDGAEKGVPLDKNFDL